MFERNYSFLPSLSVVLPLLDVPKTVFCVNQNMGAQAVVRGGHGPLGPSVATALLSCKVNNFLSYSSVLPMSVRGPNKNYCTCGQHVNKLFYIIHDF